MFVLAQAAPLDLPQIDWRAIAPELALLLAGVVALLWVAFMPERRTATVSGTPAATRAPGGAGASGATVTTGAGEGVAARQLTATATATITTPATGSGLATRTDAAPAAITYGTRASRAVLLAITLLGLAAATALTWWNWDLRSVAFDGAFAQDGITRYVRLILLPVGLLGALMAAHELERDRRTPAEVMPLMLIALAGMSLFAAASDLLVAFIALEILSLSLYTMVGASHRQRAQEAAMKYFLLGAFSSAFLLYGIALVYGATGSTNFRAIAATGAGADADLTLLLAGVALLAVGFLFKIAAVPFHMWTPDVYQGAPSSVTAFMAAGTKAAGFAAFLRLFVGALGGLATAWRPAIAVVAVLTMLAGSVLALVQTDVKRILAYSAVAHAGFLLIGLAAATPAGVSASMFYLLSYAFIVMGAFMVVQYASRADATSDVEPSTGERIGERSSLDDFRGFGRRHPVAGALLALFLFSLAGIPPALSGFWAKYFVFQAGVDAGLTWLVVVGVVTSAIAAFFYLRIAVVAFLTEPDAATDATDAADAAAEETGRRAPLLNLALGAAAVVTVAISVAPSVLVTAARAAGSILG